jgi:stress response protein SCP2
MFFSISTCATILKKVKQPYIRLTDADTDMELCRYNLEQKSLGKETAAIMCKMYKTNDCWNVVALGELGGGRCTERYATIVQTIKNKLLNKN